MQPIDWIPPCPPFSGDAARRYNKAHKMAFQSYWHDHPNSTWEQRNEAANEKCRELGITPNSAEVVEIAQSNFRDVPASLRIIAEEIERGEYGKLQSAAVVLRFVPGSNAPPQDDIAVFGLGQKSEEGESHMLLHAGAEFLLRRRLRVE